MNETEIERLATQLLKGGIKPEIGNPDHIKAIRFMEDHIPEKGLHNYQVTLTRSAEFVTVVNVEATDKEEAIEIAKESPFEISDMVNHDDDIGTEVEELGLDGLPIEEQEQPPSPCKLIRIKRT